MKENNILSDINKLLADNISQDEREILSHAKKELEKNHPFLGSFQTSEEN
ncbi:hypothetical protein [Leuconostoc gasicomitatum]|nr:hypothetical protein [Leuconostoc gasicomitatum]